MTEEGFTLNRAQILSLMSLAYSYPSDTTFRVWELKGTPAGPGQVRNKLHDKLMVDVESVEGGLVDIKRLRYELPQTGGKIKAGSSLAA